MAENANKNEQPKEEVVVEENNKNWKQVAANWGKRVLWAGIGAGITIGIQALRNRRKSRQQQ